MIGGVDLKVLWHDQSTNWRILLKVLKMAHPTVVAEYTLANGLQHEPDFKRWVIKALQKQDYVIGKVQIRAVCKSVVPSLGLPFCCILMK